MYFKLNSLNYVDLCPAVFAKMQRKGKYKYSQTVCDWTMLFQNTLRDNGQNILKDYHVLFSTTFSTKSCDGQWSQTWHLRL